MSTELQKIKQVYRWAKSRCQNPNVKQWCDYGGRGIEFRFKSYEEFLNVLGNRPIGYSLDRINNDGHYEINNVKWSSRQEQNSNKRVYKTSTTGITGINFIAPKGKYKTPRYNVRKYIEGKRVELYKGPSLEKAKEIYYQTCT